MGQILIVKPGRIPPPGKLADHIIGFGQQIPHDLSRKQGIIFKYDDAIPDTVGCAALIRLFQSVPDGSPHLFQLFIRIPLDDQIGHVVFSPSFCISFFTFLPSYAAWASVPAALGISACSFAAAQ